MVTATHAAARRQSDSHRLLVDVSSEDEGLVGVRPDRSDIVRSWALTVALIATSLALWAVLLLAVVETAVWLLA